MRGEFEREKEELRRGAASEKPGSSEPLPRLDSKRSSNSRDVRGEFEREREDFDEVRLLNSRTRANACRGSR